MELSEFQKFLTYLVEASKIVQLHIPEGNLEGIGFQLNITQAAQWVRNFREAGQPKDYVISAESLERQAKNGSVETTKQ